ncbi:uncharacterized protein LOC121633495 isoform X2 [Melanotaenia boesemani]|uniref:uncharacterized protein LOC121633495 isoform X2 n=1 Tax=Melanotaenia boesemani TaxID=1250792 RepID=UPI001C055970|nr:uncharacterized protein LOC121633495 isoform X2 [Melanotaenia boesemani]
MMKSTFLISFLVDVCGVKLCSKCVFFSSAGVSGGIIDLYNKPGDEVVIPCNSKPSSSSCSNVHWFYSRDERHVFQWEVKEGNVDENSARAARLSVNSNCSLIINNITDEDVGFYICRLGRTGSFDADVYLNILTVSPSPPDADLQKDEVTLTCSLWRFSNINPCKQSSFRWLDDEGTELQDESVDFYVRQTNCVSNLTVKHQRDHNRRFTCQFVEGNSVKIEAHYTPDSTESQQTIIIIIGAVVGVMLLFFIITVFIIKCRRRTKETEDQRITNVQTTAAQDDETENNVTYATVDHAHPKVSSKKKVKEEEDVVTYSAVRTKTDAEVDNDPSSYYSCVNLPE